MAEQLEHYKQKRNFKKTAEPAGGKPARQAVICRPET
jgi:hypothetical protein